MCLQTGMSLYYARIVLEERKHNPLKLGALGAYASMLGRSSLQEWSSCAQSREFQDSLALELVLSIYHHQG